MIDDDDHGPTTLAIDIGGTNLKAGLLDGKGSLLGERIKIPTMHPSTPERVVPALVDLATGLGRFDRVSVGFPGRVSQGKVHTAPKLGNEAWLGYDLAGEMRDRLGKPVRILNDATIQGLGVISGIGLECVITLGTGFGFALFHNGRMTPHIDLSQHTARKNLTYNQYIGKDALEDLGRKRWCRRLKKLITQLQILVDFDCLYIGGGNASLIEFSLPDKVRIVSNDAGITGGVHLWDLRLADFFGADGA